MSFNILPIVKRPILWKLLKAQKAQFCWLSLVTSTFETSLPHYSSSLFAFCFCLVDCFTVYLFNSPQMLLEVSKVRQDLTLSIWAIQSICQPWLFCGYYPSWLQFMTSKQNFCYKQSCNYKFKKKKKKEYLGKGEEGCIFETDSWFWEEVGHGEGEKREIFLLKSRESIQRGSVASLLWLRTSTPASIWFP